MNATPVSRRGGLVAMLTAGVKLVAHHPYLVLALYLVQVALSAVVGVAVAAGLGGAFGEHPVLDQAADGDFNAAMAVLRHDPGLFRGLLWGALAAVLVYVMLSWFLRGGLIAIAIADEKPESGREVAWRFGAGGAATFLAYARLWLWSLIPYGVGVIGLAIGLAMWATDIEYATRIGDVMRSLAWHAWPGALALFVTAVAVDYARVDLSRFPALSSWRALVRSLRLVVRRPRALAHAALYVAAFAAVTAALFPATSGRSPSGIGSVFLVLALRQLASATRFTAHVICLGGQVQLSRARQTAPPTRKQS